MTTLIEAPARTAWTIDGAHSFAEFAVKHMMVETVKGRFNSVTGSLELDEANPANSSATLVIDATSVDSGLPSRDKHLRSDDFFGVEQYPEITFRSTSLRPLKDDRWVVTGDLTIRDVTKEIEVETEFEGRIVDSWGNDRIAFTGTTSVSRKEFGLRWNMAIEAGGFAVSDRAKLTVHLGVTRDR